MKTMPAFPVRVALLAFLSATLMAQVQAPKTAASAAPPPEQAAAPRPSAGKQATLAPGMAGYTDDVLFGDV